MSTTDSTRIPAEYWLVCPEGHYVAEAKQDVSFSHMGWSARLRWLQPKTPDYRCSHEDCRALWLRQEGGQAHVTITRDAPPEA